MTVYLVRHGRTFWNKIKRIQGSIDQPLDEEGIRQAHLLGSHLQGISFERIYSSPLQRAHETAQILNQYVQKEIVLEPVLTELSFGSAEGLTKEEYHRLYAERLSIAKALPPDLRMQYRVIPDGESISDGVARVLPFLNDLSLSATGKNLLVISHGGVIRSLLVSLFGLDDSVAFIENSGYVILEYLNGQLNLYRT